MAVLLAIALKSLLIAGATLGLLALTQHRSAAERSSIAHIGLVALLLLAFAPLVLPAWSIEAPALLGHAPAVQAPVHSTQAVAGSVATVPSMAATPAPAAGPASSLSAAAFATAFYAVPAAILLIITLLALGRLISLRARAEVLVDGHWLSALARAQRRMGFKHGTALLTSNELASPISWGLMRPVILLNNRAVAAQGEAEAIISHELAHVARLDWAKLLLARIATALFWFNPLVWLLAREAHQLREEAADDAVLGADIADTDYAQLLVGVARHECSGLLLGAHGVAPSKSSLARRVARVLDRKSPRGPAPRAFALGVFTGALVVAAPLAALTLTPGGPQFAQRPMAGGAGARLARTAAPADIPHIIASGVSTSVASAVAAVAPAVSNVELDARKIALVQAREARASALKGAQVAVAEAHEAADRARQVRGGRDNAIDRAIEMKSAGVTPEYVAAMRAAAPHLGGLDASDFVAMKSIGVTPQFAADLVNSGLRGIDDDELVQARAIGLTGAYVRAMIAAGVRASFDDFVQLRAVGVSPDYVQRLRRAGYVFRNVDQLVEMRAVGIGPEDLTSVRRAPPVPPRPPKVPPPGWNPLEDADPDGG